MLNVQSDRSKRSPALENTETGGGTRYSRGKPGGWWYAPIYGLRLVAEVWTAGADKYAPLDWLEGQSFSTLLDCAFRHTLEVMLRGPWARDEDTGAYHAACAAWNWLCLLTFMVLDRRDLDDVTPWRGVTAEDRRAAADLWADGHPGSIMELASELAKGRRELEEEVPDLSGLFEDELDDKDIQAPWASDLNREII